MRKKQQQTHVRTITTGHVEADMLGQVYIWLSERKNSKYAQRPHKTTKRTRKLNISERYIRAAFKRSLTAPTACWRSLKVLKGNGKVIYTKVVNRVRKLFVNS
jgi:hypothetical protein